MVPDTSPAADARPPNGNSTVVNALLGGIAGVILSFVPLSPILGGGIAGYLEGGRPGDALKVGAVAGLVMLVPFAFLLFLLLFFLGFGGAPAAFGLFGLLILLFSALYTVGLSVLGGYLGAYVKTER